MGENLSMRQFEEYAQKVIDKHAIPGVAVGLNQDGNRIYEKGFGYRNVAKQLEVTPDTVFGIASMTKSFTAVAIMKLHEQGKLSVLDKISTYLPEFKTPDAEKTEKMTIHHFLTHTSGLPPLSSHLYARKRSIEKDPSAKDYPGLDLSNHPDDPIDTYEELMDYIGKLDIKLLDEPGKAFSYSNDAYGLLGAIVSRVSGQSYESFVEEYILQPAGMKNSSFFIEEYESNDNVTTLYATKKVDGEEQAYEAPLWWDAPAMRAGGYLKSTVNDILLYKEIFRNEGVVGNTQILTKESVQRLTYPHVEIEPGKYYGYGLMVVPDFYGATLIEHGGGLKGVSSLMFVVPETNVSGVILTNLAGVPAGDLLMAALNVAENRNPEAPVVQLSTKDVPVENMEKFVGTFTSDEGMKAQFAVEKEQLVLCSGDDRFPMRAIDENLFVTKTNSREEVIRFIEDDGGNIERIAYHFRQIYKD